MMLHMRLTIITAGVAFWKNCSCAEHVLWESAHVDTKLRGPEVAFNTSDDRG